MTGIFISYRREDSAGYAGRLYDGLRQHFGAERVFMDVAGIEPGMDFEIEIEKAIGACDAVLVVIGRHWLEVSGPKGRRLDDPKDFVRLEVAAAARREVRVVPVLVGGAAMPSADQLPDVLKPLARRQATTLSDEHWDIGVQDLMRTLDRRARDGPGRVLAERRSGASVLHRRRAPLLIAGLAVLAAAAAVVGWRWQSSIGVAPKLVPEVRMDEYPPSSGRPRPSGNEEAVVAGGPSTSVPSAAGSASVASSAPTAAAPGEPAGLRFTPATLDFGARRVNTSSAESVVISNAGSSVPTLREVQFGGREGNFSLAAGSCVGNTLVSGERCTVHVYFAPRSEGRHETTLTVIDANGKAHPGTRIAGEGTLGNAGFEDATVEVPRLVRQSYDQAFFALGKAGLAVGNVSLRASDKVPTGMVLQQMTTPGVKVRPRTAIDFVVSVQAQPASVTVLTRGPPAAAPQDGTPAMPQILHFVYDPVGARLCYGVARATKVRIEPTVGRVQPSVKGCADVNADSAQRFTLYASNAAGQTVNRTTQVVR